MTTVACVQHTISESFVWPEFGSLGYLSDSSIALAQLASGKIPLRRQSSLSHIACRVVVDIARRSTCGYPFVWAAAVKQNQAAAQDLICTQARFKAGLKSLASLGFLDSWGPWGSW